MTPSGALSASPPAARNGHAGASRRDAGAASPVVAPPARPAVAVVVASHGRPARLAALLDALGEQSLERARWEAVVVHDGSGPETTAVLGRHPLVVAGVVRAIALAPGQRSPAVMRNAGWRAARAPLVAFTDDDCRPPRDWLARAVAAAERHPGAILQGPTRPDPHEAEHFRSSLLVHSRWIEPAKWGHTCNIAYPRTVLERIEGFDERFERPVGEDVDLLARARRAGAPRAAIGDLLMHHAVEPTTLREQLGLARRHGQLAVAMKRNPEYRRGRNQPLGLFISWRHAWFALSALALLAAPRRPPALLAVLPWIVSARTMYGSSYRGRWPARLPALWIVDLVQLLALARASARHRTLLL